MKIVNSLVPGTMPELTPQADELVRAACFFAASGEPSGLLHPAVEFNALVGSSEFPVEDKASTAIVQSLGRVAFEAEVDPLGITGVTEPGAYRDLLVAGREASRLLRKQGSNVFDKEPWVECVRPGMVAATVYERWMESTPGTTRGMFNHTLRLLGKTAQPALAPDETEDRLAQAARLERFQEYGHELAKRTVVSAVLALGFGVMSAYLHVSGAAIEEKFAPEKARLEYMQSAVASSVSPDDWATILQLNGEGMISLGQQSREEIEQLVDHANVIRSTDQRLREIETSDIFTWLKAISGFFAVQQGLRAYRLGKGRLMLQEVAKADKSQLQK